MLPHTQDMQAVTCSKTHSLLKGSPAHLSCSHIRGAHDKPSAACDLGLLLGWLCIAVEICSVLRYVVRGRAQVAVIVAAISVHYLDWIAVHDGAGH